LGILLVWTNRQRGLQEVPVALVKHRQNVGFVSAFELYADLRNDLDDAFNMADRFEKTFARDDVRVDFIGAWYVSVSYNLIFPDRD